MTQTPADGPAAGVGRCPSCGARVVAEQDWCTLCLQPLRLATPTSGAPGSSEPTGPVPGAEPHPADPADPVGPVDPVDPYSGLQPPAAPAPEAALPPGVAEAMLAELAATSAADRPLARGPLAGTSRAVRLTLGCGAAVLLALVLVGLLGLVGLLL